MNTNTKSYRVYLLLLEKSLSYEELTNIFNKDTSEILAIVCTSLNIYLKEIDPDDLNQEYLNNLQTTILDLLKVCNKSNLGKSLNIIKKIRHKTSIHEINSFINGIEELLINKLNDIYQYSNYEFLSCIIYEIKSVSYLKQILNTYPHYINTRNFQNKHIALELIDKLLEQLDKPSSHELTYYNSVILEFITRQRFHISNNELKAYCLKINILMRQLNPKDKNYNKRLSFYKTILNNLLDKEITLEQLDIINTKYGIKTGFSLAIQDEIKEIQKEDYIITIDPEGTLDMDDAFSIKKINDYYNLKIYITDVASKVKLNSQIDIEALKRSETIYLSDLTIYMLPVELSNIVLSLNTLNYKNTLCFEFDICDNGEVKNFKIKKEFVKISKNLTIDEANIILNSSSPIKELEETLNYLNIVAQILKRKDENKKLYRLVEDYTNAKKGINNGKNAYILRTKSEVIVEELMMLVNTYVAKYFSDKNYPFIYRVHPSCSLKEDYEILMQLKKNLSLNGNDQNIKMINSLINMYPNAYYDVNNIGHYGLNRDYYSHSSSADRRYVDIVIQRLIYDYIFFNPTKKKDIYWEKRLKEICQYCNDRMKQNIQYQVEYERAKRLIKNNTNSHKF